MKTATTQTATDRPSHKFPYNWKLSDGYPPKNGYTVFSCFACGGGSTMGYKLAGFDVIGCNEIDPKMMAAYRANHNPRFSYLEPIQTFKDRDDLPSELYNLDILDGSPPCSSFSMCGNREKDWGKEKKFREGQADQVLDTLFFDFIELGKKLQPKVIVAENVRGLLCGDAKAYVDKILTEFDKAGYHVDFKLCNSASMGVPQRRERVFFYAIRKDIYAGPFVDLFQTQPLLNIDFDEHKIPFRNIKTTGDRKPIQPAIVDAYEYCRRNKTPDFAKYFEDVLGKRKYFNTRLIFADAVCDTIKGECTHVIDGTAAYINDAEILSAGSYPTDYNFCGSKPSYLVGMSVPPVMTAQVATRIKHQWLDKTTAKARSAGQ